MRIARRTCRLQQRPGKRLGAFKTLPVPLPTRKSGTCPGRVGKTYLMSGDDLNALNTLRSMLESYPDSIRQGG
jgi:hypothetical protein